MALEDAIEISTAESTRSCLGQFTLCVSKLNGVQRIHINNRYADFRLWADSIGAIAQGQACLDWRFRDRPDDILFIKGLLEMLELFLQECAASSGNEESVEETLRKVDSMMHNLISIGVAIRRSGRKSRLQKADASFERNRERYLDLRAHLACVLISNPNEGPRTLSDSDHFAKVELSPIQNRLVEANLRRRHQFMEAQRHSHLLKGSTRTMPDRFPMQQQVNEILSTIGTKHPTEDPEIPRVGPKLKGAQTATAARINTMTAPGTIASTPETGFKGLQHKGPARSTVTRITSITAAARYPRAKILSMEEFSFKCPCCCQAIPTKEAEDSQFRKHLANDICPYTCILDNCPTPYKLFVTEKEWNEHFMNAHPLKFQCPYCDSTTLNSLAGLTSHLQLHHSEISDDELADSLANSAVHVMGITKCPLCDSEDAPDSPELIEHILEHIHDFSLRSLPWPKDPEPNPNKAVGTFNTTVQDVNRIIQWVNKSSPKKEHQLQISDFDKSSPIEEDTASKHSKIDYFAQNDYFMDESSDGRFLSESGQSHMSDSRSRQSATSKLDDLQDWETEAYNNPTYVPDVQGFSEDDDFYGLDTHADEMPNAEMHNAEDKGKINAEKLDEENQLFEVTFSPDGRMLAVASSDKTVKLWDAATGVGAAPQTLEGYSDWVRAVVFSPDGKMVASGSEDDTIWLWDSVTRAHLLTLEGHLGPVDSVAFSPDGKVIASGSYDKTVRLWDAITGEVMQTLKGHLSSVHSVAFSPDGKMIASGSTDKTVRLWDAITGEVMQTLEGHWDSVNSVAFSPDGRVIASCSDDETVKQWDAITGQVMQTFKGHLDSVNSVAFSPDGKMIASGSYDKTVRLWDAITGEVMQTFEGHLGIVNSVAFSPDGKVIASCSDDGIVKQWDTGPGLGERTPQEFVKLIDTYIKENRMLNTFVMTNGEFIKDMAKKAADLAKDTSSDLGSKRVLLKTIQVTLHQQAIYCDDSNFTTDRKGMDAERWQSQMDVAKRIARITTRILPKGEGVALRFINKKIGGPANLDLEGISEILDSITRAGLQDQPGERTIGTGLREHILKPMVYSPLMERGQERPLLVTIFTCGSPSGEDKQTLVNVIVECGDWLESQGHPRDSVKFLVGRIGWSIESVNFQISLKDAQDSSPALASVLHVLAGGFDDFNLFPDERMLDRQIMETLFKPLEIGGSI